MTKQDAQYIQSAFRILVEEGKIDEAYYERLIALWNEIIHKCPECCLPNVYSSNVQMNTVQMYFGENEELCCEVCPEEWVHDISGNKVYRGKCVWSHDEVVGRFPNDMIYGTALTILKTISKDLKNKKQESIATDIH